MFADTDAQGPKSTESNRKNISSPQVAQTTEDTPGAGVGGSGTLHPSAN